MLTLSVFDVERLIRIQILSFVSKREQNVCCNYLKRNVSRCFVPAQPKIGSHEEFCTPRTMHARVPLLNDDERAARLRKVLKQKCLVLFGAKLMLIFPT